MSDCLVYKKTQKSGLSVSATKKIVFYIQNNLKIKGDLSVHFIGRDRMKKMNFIYRNKNKVTDVLSFAINDGKFFLNKEEKELGDIFICFEQVKKQAKENKINYEEELKRILIHGVLHLAGYDHTKENEAKKMFCLQEKILRDIL